MYATLSRTDRASIRASNSVAVSLLPWLQKSCSASRAAFFSTIVPTPRCGGSDSKTPAVRSDIPLAEYTSHQGSSVFVRARKKEAVNRSFSRPDRPDSGRSCEPLFSLLRVGLCWSSCYGDVVTIGASSMISTCACHNLLRVRACVKVASCVSACS